MTGSTIDRAQGRWREILPQCGIETRFLQNKHGPCPLCGGKDRFRFDDKGGSGSYYCNQCGAGCGLILVRKLRGWDFKTACDEVDKIIGTGPAPAKVAPTRQSDADHRRAAIERVISEARQPQVVRAYLARRGLNVTSPVLRGHARCPYFDDDHRRIGCFPAVIAPILGPDGSLENAMRIYDADISPRKKTLPSVSTLNGAAARLFEPENGVLGVAEGIETALACRELFGVPTWAAICDHGLKTFSPPPEVTTLHIFGDNDPKFAGQAAAYCLAQRLLAPKDAMIKVRVNIPTVEGADFLDILNRQARR